MVSLVRNLLNVFTNPVRNLCGNSFSLLNRQTAFNCNAVLPASVVPQRNKNYYTDWRMIRDVKRRKVVKEYAKLRLQINCIRKNTLLPQEVKDIAQKEIEALPTDSCHTKLHWRCILTSRARGRFKKFRMQRIIWRHFADYNQVSGVERAMW
ncbi:hypothetical protein JTE90_019032 [Oedothorax gibbosus]|uniref:28S ribosomal protein S14, mitochondrial n=1 Tax=Oedothorax gibbosus TaxID=931172 RepID=A0AAV6UZZ3_9ARAC|nr:hypothetical protein JTE90_019032 [Oedothorax gibbosus]